MFDWLKPNDVLWMIPAAPLLACLWIVVVGHVVRRQYAHRPVVVALAISAALSFHLLLNVVPTGFVEREHGTHADTGAAHEHADHEHPDPEAPADADKPDVPVAQKHAHEPKLPTAISTTIYEWIRIGPPSSPSLSIPV